MKSAILISGAAVLSMALMACNNDPAQAVAPQADVVADETAADVPAATSMPATDATVEMPHGFAVPFEHTVVRDRTVTMDDGKQQRRMQLLASGIAPNEAEAELAEAFSTLGFKGGKVLEREGQRSINYRKDGKVLVVVTVGAGAEAGSDVRFGWNLE